MEEEIVCRFHEDAIEGVTRLLRENLLLPRDRTTVSQLNLGDRILLGTNLNRGKDSISKVTVTRGKTNCLIQTMEGK